MINWIEMENEARLPVLTGQQVQSNLRDKIETNIRLTTLPERNKVYTYPPLFSFTGSKFSSLEDWDGQAVGKVESERLQRLGIGVLKEFGWSEDGLRQNGSELVNDKAYAWENRVYESKIVKGLTFERKVRSIATTGKILSVEWRMLGLAPEVKKSNTHTS